MSVDCLKKKLREGVRSERTQYRIKALIRQKEEEAETRSTFLKPEVKNPGGYEYSTGEWV